MKPPLVPGATSQSCSCTSCMYKSESERLSIRKIIAGGSRIDKLYYGKYIPLREQKLLDRLVRTRAVYDDIRTQLLSESDISVKEKPNLKPRKHQARPKEMAATDKNSAILEIVDLVDKGKVSGGKNLSDCCSCCSCGSVHTQSHERKRRHRHGHARGHARGGAYTMSRTSMIRKKMGDVKRSVRFKAKSIRSAPCTCTCRISGMIKRKSQEMIKRLRPEGSRGMEEKTGTGLEMEWKTYEQNVGGKKKRKVVQKTYQKIRKSRTRLMQSMGEGARKLNESRTRIKELIKAEGNKSIEKIKLANHKVKENVKPALRKSMQRQQPPTEELNFEFSIKKDSITKFKERLQRKKLKDYYACEHECNPNKCVPDDCFKIIKLRRVRREEKGRRGNDNVSLEKKIGVTSSASNVAVQAQKKGTTVTTETDHKQKDVLKRKRPSVEQRITVDVGIKKTGNEARVTVSKSPKVKDMKVPYCACEEELPKENKSVKSIANLPPVTEPVSQQQTSKPRKGQEESVGIEIRKGKTAPPDKSVPAAGKINMRTRARGRNVKLDSELEKSSQMKLKHSRNESQTGNRALKRCFCTLKLKAKGNKFKPTNSTSRSITTASQSVTSTRKLDQADKNVKPRQKSVSSLTSKSLSTGSVITPAENKVVKIEKRSTSSHKLEQLDENASQRQVVHIGSTFSFSVEFYKDKPTNKTLDISQDQAIEDRVKKQNRGTSKRKHLRHRHSQISSSTGKSKYTLTKHSLRRCFCTLKLAHANKKKTKHTTRSQGSTVFLETPNVTINANKAIATTKKYKLSPYECEPGICVPGECDPYVCVKRINTKQMKHRTKQSNTDNRRTKSTSSVTSRAILNKAKKVQSTTATYRSPSKKHKDKGKALRKIRTTPSSPERQVVRIGSSFSFNIEFYKDNEDKSSPPIDDVPKERPSKSSNVSKIPVKDRGYQEKVKKLQKSTSMLVKKKNRGSFIGPAMERCFCTLKLKKKQQKREIDQATIGTVTPVKNVNYQNAQIYETKGTKTKQEKHKFGYVLEPYECEPNVCIPGECDPYECMKRIQMRQLKESGTSTEKAKMKSATSITHKLKYRAKGALAKTKYKPKKVSTNVKTDESKFEFVEQQEKRQAVRIGSTFSFDVEFHKDLVSPTTIVKKSMRQIKGLKVPKKLKHSGSGVRESSSSHQNTQVATIKKTNKAAGIRPMLKRCFCTLKLQGKNDQKFETNIKAPKVITVSRVTITKTEITDSKTLKILPAKNKSHGFKWAAAMYNINSSSTLSKSSMVFQYKEMKSYFHEQKSINSFTSNSVSEKRKFFKASRYKMLVPSNLTLPARHSKHNGKYALSEHCILRPVNKEKLRLQRRSNILRPKERHSVFCNKSRIFSEPHTNINDQQQDIKIVGYSQISSPHFYAMNKNVPQKNKNTAKIHKLKPYECEPGVCIPDECDPYECDKLIKKRLMKRVDRMSGTDMRSKSISSYASQSTSHTKTKKQQSKRTPREKVKKWPAGGIKYESTPNRKNRQVVRVGSSFSFNIEFAKDKSKPVEIVPVTSSKPPKHHKPTKAPKKIVKAKGTRGYGVRQHDQDSQSVTLTENRGSGMKPMMQRCFCTLKLQKKGKNQKVKKVKPVQIASNIGTATPPNTMKDFVASRTMINVGQNTAKPYKLLPYECEPRVCIPGECNPYECLERIKKRNKKVRSSGTAAMQYKTSSSSNTGQRTRTQARQIQSKPRRRKMSKESTASRPSKVVTYHGKPSRQAVRVGSSFSFNVEFFKENSPTSSSPRVAQRESHPPLKHVKRPKQKVQKKKVRVVALQNEKNMKHTQSQIGNVINQVKSTMTSSLIKRCFCTAKLHGKRKPPKQELLKKEKVKPTETQSISVDSKASQAKQTKTFLKRCFCVLKLKKAEQNPKQKNVKANTNAKVAVAPTHVDKKVVTAPYKHRVRNLDPYECEPGICVPGECNPYECKKLIKARNVKLDTREMFTDRARTKSTSSSFKSSKTSKARRTQSNFGSTTTSRQQATKTVKESPSSFETIRTSPNRQVVRIGSNFSFNIEFYKDRSPNTEKVQAAAKAIQRRPESRSKIKTDRTGKEKKHKHQTSNGKSVVTADHESQVDKNKMQDKGAGITPALKRCFCTLKLQKRNIPKQAKQAKYTTQKTGTEVRKEIPTHQNRGNMTSGKNWKLEPYECEPNVCIPYECDPYECEKLIKKRNLKDTTKAVMTTKEEKYIGYKLLPYECEPNFCIPGQCDPNECIKRIKMRNMKHKTSGTTTKKYKKKSISNDIRSTASKSRKVQSPYVRDRRRSKSVSSKPHRSMKSLGSTRQSVKIGSGFSFDIEFCKNKSLSRPEVEVRPVKQRTKRTKSVSSPAQRRFAKTRDSKLQYHKPMRDTDSQILAQKMRDTGVNPFLKRCFCTLKLQKSGDVGSKHAVGRAARDRDVYLASLLPYECEPGVCVPGQCDPYECEKTIKRRQMRSQVTGTEKRSRNSSTTTAGAKYRASKKQAMRDTKAQKHQKSNYAKREYRETRRPISSQNSSRQAVRIGSSFKFDVEFYKDNAVKLDKRPHTYGKPPKMAQQMKTKPLKTHSRSRSITSNEKRRQHYKAQTTGSKTESKGSGVGPLLKRCFCTLALHKKSPPTSKIKPTYRNDDLSDLYQYSRNVGVGTGKKFYSLKPYECEPNICIPGQCDPYECYERIKRRLKDTGTETPKPKRKHGTSITSKQAKYKSTNTQSIKEKARRDRRSVTTIRERIRKQRAPKYTISSGESTRQAVKIGSNFSFSVEFFKERPNAVKIPKAVYKMKGLDTNPKRHRTSKTGTSQKNSISRLSDAAKKGYNQQCQEDYIQHASKRTTVGAFIKRCFCTLNLHKNQPNAVPKINEKSTVSKIPKVKNPAPSPDVTRQAVTQTKEKYTASKAVPFKLKPYECEPNVCVPGDCNRYECLERIKRRNIPFKLKSYECEPNICVPGKCNPYECLERIKRRNIAFKLKSYECEPNVCVPGKCNPYECLERIKKRNIRRHSHRTGTHMRSSQVSVASMASRLVPRTSRRVQSGVKRTGKVSQPQQVSQVVEQPRFAHMFDSPNRTGVKLGSNISFHIEFYKDKSQVPVADYRTRYYDYDEPKEPKLKRKRKETTKTTFSESRPKKVHKSIGDRSYGTRTSEAQADSAVMKNKSTGVNNMLNRCFCTLKLQKNAAKVITVNRVTVEEDYRMSYKRTQAPRNNCAEQNPSLLPFPANQEYHDLSTKKMESVFERKIRSGKRKNCINEHISRFSESKEMKTLYPYTPKKFNKNVSNTVLLRNADLHHNNMYEKFYTFEPSLNIGDVKPGKPIDFNRKNNIYLGRASKNGEKNFNEKKSSRKLFLQKLFAWLFSKRKSDETVKDKIVLCESNNFLLKPDTLKTSKSDRRPASIRTVPKKTTSLKVAKISDKTRPNKKEINCQKHKKFFCYQSGDTGQVYTSANRHAAKTRFENYDNFCSRNFHDIKKKNMFHVRPTFENEKIVQMAIIQPKSKKGKNAMATTATNTQIKKTRTKNVETSDNTITNEGILEKCKCFLRNVLSKKNTKIKHKSEVLRTGKNDIKSGGTEVTCETKSKNKMSPFQAGDENLPQQQKVKKWRAKRGYLNKTPPYKTKATGDVKSKNKMSPFHAGDENLTQQQMVKKWRAKRGYLNKTTPYKTKAQKRMSALQSGDAPEMTGELIKNKNQFVKRKTTITDPAKCKHPSPCPCCKSGKRKSQLSTGEPASKATDGKRKSKGGGKDKQTHLGYTYQGKKPYGAKISIKAKGPGGMFSGGTFSGGLFSGRTVAGGKVGSSNVPQPCVCGTKICGREKRKLAVMKKKKETKTARRCICGSEECARVAKGGKLYKRKKRELSQEEIQKRKEKMQILQKKKEKADKIRNIHEQELLKKFKAEDKARRARRLKAEQVALKQAEKFKNADPCLLTVESGLDVVKMLGKTGADLARFTSRSVLHPHLTYRKLQNLAKNPGRVFSTVGDAVHESSLVSTCSRIRRRCAGMICMRAAKKKMESNLVTNFLLHAADPDPTKRLTYKAKKKKKLKRRREPIDFECSLFMASLRRRPCLAVYYTCPWFYPHCLSMLTLWKQFTDVMLFLIAVTVWSPCIVAMEICRAFVCCFFCTG